MEHVILYTDQLRSDILKTLLSSIGARATRRIFFHFRHIEKSHGVKRLLAYMVNVKDKLLDLHAEHGRNKLIRLVRSGEVKWPGPTNAIFNVSLHSLETALNLIDLRGLFQAPEPDEKRYRKKAQEMARQSDPFLDHQVPTWQSADRLNAFGHGHHILRSLAREVEQENGNEPMIKFDYPTCPKKQYIGGKRYPGYDVIPSQLISQLYDIAPIVYQKYDYFRFLVGEDHMPSRESFSGPYQNETFAYDLVLLTKDFKLKERPIFVFPAMAHLAVSPLHEFADKLLDKIPSSFVKNQMGGVAAAGAHLERGAVTSLDLDDASGNISLTSKTALMRRLMPAHKWREDIIEIYIFLSRSKGRTPYEKVHVQARKGDLQGLVGSFRWFMIWIIDQFLQVGMTFDDFSIVGDDQCFMHKFYARLIQRFKEADISINLLKSIIGNEKYVVFCSRVVFIYQDYLHYYKAKAFNYDNPIMILERLGPKALKYFDSRFTDKKLVNPLQWASFKKRASLDRKALVLEEEKSLEQGGYTLSQYHKMGLIDRDSFIALLWLARHRYTEIHMSLDELLETAVPFEEEKVRVVGRKVQKYFVKRSIVIGHHVPSLMGIYGKQSSNSREVPRGDFLRTFADSLGIPRANPVDNLIEENLDLLHSELTEQGVTQLSAIQPQYNSGESRLYYKVKAKIEEKLKYSKLSTMEEIGFRSFLQSYEKPPVAVAAANTLKPMVKASVSAFENDVAFNISSTLYTEELLDTKVIDSDIEEGEKFRQEVTTLAPWWLAFLNKPTYESTDLNPEKVNILDWVMRAYEKVIYKLKKP